MRYDKTKNRVFCASQQCFPGRRASDAIGLVMKMDNCLFTEALRKVADHYGISAVSADQASRRSSFPQPKRRPLPTARNPPSPTKPWRRLQSKGYHAVVAFEYTSALRKVRFEHDTLLQEGKNRPLKEFRWEYLAGGVWYSGDGNLPKPLYKNAFCRECDQLGLAIGFEGEAKADLAGKFGFAAFSFKDLTDEQAAELVDCDVILWSDKLTTVASTKQKAQPPKSWRPGRLAASKCCYQLLGFQRVEILSMLSITLVGIRNACFSCWKQPLPTRAPSSRSSPQQMYPPMGPTSRRPGTFRLKCWRTAFGSSRKIKTE